MLKKTLLIGAAALLALALSAWPARAGLGLEVCQERAWPGGPHLGQQSDRIITLYYSTWGDQACEKWAAEHRESAIEGLRALRFEVNRPAAPVLQVDGLTFRGRGRAAGEITLERGCYVAWIDYTDRTPERLLAEGWSFWEQTWERPWIYAYASDPEAELREYDGFSYANEEGLAASNSVGRMIEVTDRGVRSGRFDPAQSMAPGQWRWRVNMPRAAEAAEWELRLIPTEYAVAPWDFWAQQEWTPPCPTQQTD